MLPGLTLLPRKVGLLCGMAWQPFYATNARDICSDMQEVVTVPGAAACRQRGAANREGKGEGGGGGDLENEGDSKCPQGPTYAGGVWTKG